MRYRKLQIGFCSFLLMVFLCGCKSQPQMVSKSGFYFDTVINIEIESDRGEALLDECFSLCDHIEKTFSRTLETSELYQLNHRTSNQVEVSEELADLISLGLEYGELTEGAFDITIAPISDLWDFKSDNPALPSQESIDEALRAVDYTKVHVAGNTITFDNEYTQIDLGAVAKGYAADSLKEYLTSEGISTGIINLGGNVLTIGEKDDGGSWNVGIQKPFSERNEIITQIAVQDKSVVSSGVYERYFKQDEQLYHHILDPKTGYPVQTDLWQTTIVSDLSVQGDLLSTSCMLLGYDKAKKLLQQFPEAAAYFVDVQGHLIEN